jgi:hypothetical protein
VTAHLATQDCPVRRVVMATHVYGPVQVRDNADNVTAMAMQQLVILSQENVL